MLRHLVIARRRSSHRRTHAMSTAAATAPGGATAPATRPQSDRLSMAASSLVVEYYVRQGVFPREDVPAIVETLQAPLPACFRVNPNSRAASHIVGRLRDEFPTLFASVEAVAPNGERVTAPRELPWFPTRHGAWQLDCGKTTLAKQAREHAPLRAFRDFLLFHTAEGNVTRQEAASMIPPLLLDVQPHHRALDLCAAPGSKTSQVMEALELQQQQTHSGASVGSLPARGLVVANDANEKRGYLLVHQLQRLGLTDAVVTCHLGQQFPGLYSRSGSSDNVVLKATDAFDRIICDVPCSGDGTIRKNRNLWRQWTPGGALTLHNTQLELALRAAELLRDDGLMVYSTCSFNPVENEAVVAELLRRAGGSLELVDCSDKLPGLVTRAGMTDWEVAWQASKKKKKGKKKDSDGDGSLMDSLVWFDDYDAVPEQLRGFRVVKSMFPPIQFEVCDQLERCMRIFPTDQNTGGFFVALIRKVGDRSEDKDESKQCWLESFEEVAARTLPVREAYVCDLCGHQTHTIRNCPMSRNVQRRQEDQEKRQREGELTNAEGEPDKRLHTYTKLRPEHWEIIKQFYGVDDAFPHDNLYGRSDGATSICLVSPHVQQTCLAGHDLKILDTGVRVFARVATSGDVLVFRPTEDGLRLVQPFITKRKLVVSAEDVERMLAVPGVTNEAGAKGDGSAHSIDTFTADLQAKTAEMRATSGVGPVLLMVDQPANGQGHDHLKPVVLPVWLGRKTLALLVDAVTRKRLQHGENGEHHGDSE